MTQSEHKISLGFAAQEFNAGVHICQIFSEDEERQDALFKFVLSGLQTEERVVCFSEKVTEKMIDEFLHTYGFSLDEAKTKGSFSLERTRDVYFKDNRFDPDRMLNLLKDFYENSITQGYSGARAIGEMTPDVQHVPGGSCLLEYESKISILLRTTPVTAVCQYDVRAFDGGTIMDVLKVHPLMVVRGAVVRNPFFVEPEEYLANRH